MHCHLHLIKFKVLHVIVLAHGPFAYPTPLAGNLPVKTSVAIL